jgi:hypothetical protein
MGLSHTLSLQHSLVHGGGRGNLISPLAHTQAPHVSQKAELFSVSVQPVEAHSPCFLSGQGTWGVLGRVELREDTEGTWWSSASKIHWPSLIYSPLPSLHCPFSPILPEPQHPPGPHSDAKQSFLFFLHVPPPALATRGRLVTRFWESQPFRSSGLEHTDHTQQAHQAPVHP